MEGRYDLLNLPSLASMEMVAKKRTCQIVGGPSPWDWEDVKYIVPNLSQSSVVPSARLRVAWRLVGEFLGNGTVSVFYFTLFNLRAARVLLRRLGTQDDSQLMTHNEARSEIQQE